MSLPAARQHQADQLAARLLDMEKDVEALEKRVRQNELAVSKITGMGQLALAFISLTGAVVAAAMLFIRILDG